MEKIKNGLRVPAMILAIIALVFRLISRGLSIADLGITVGVGMAGNLLMTASVVVILVYCFGVCNKGAGKILLGIGAAIYSFAYILWDAESIIEGYVDLYLLIELIEMVAVALFAIWLFTGMKNKIMPIISLAVYSLTYMHSIAFRINNISIFDSSYDYWYDEYYLERLATGWIFWTLFSTAMILLIIGELTRSKVPAQPYGYAPMQQPMYTAPAQQPMYTAPAQQPMYTAPAQQPVYTAPAQQPVYTAPAQQAPAQQKSEKDVKIDTLKQLFESGAISEEDYKNELMKIVSEK